MIDKDTFTPGIEFHGAKGLVYVGDKIIVFRRDTKTKLFPLLIDLPGGGIEGNETAFETFKREVMEEFGVRLTEEDIIYAKKYPALHDPNKESFFLVARPKNVTEQDVVFGNEGLEFFLMKPQEFVDLSDAVKPHQQKVSDYLDFLEQQ